MPSENPIFCAIDTTNLVRAQTMASALKNYVGGFKLGLEFFLAHGVAGYEKIASLGMPIFLDLKLHDIPNTVGGAISALRSLKPAFVTVHCSGGKAMLTAAVDVVHAMPRDEKPKILGVTVLTSLDEQDLKAVGQESNVFDQTLRLATLAKSCSLDGIICAPSEVALLREKLGPNFILMVPGIRPSWATADDQKRMMGPKEALAAGATYLVIGRPITASDSPVETAKRILAEVA